MANLEERTRAPSLDIDIFSEAYLSDPVRHYDAIRDAGPVVFLSKYGVYGVTRHAEVMATLKDFDSFCNGRGGTMTDLAKESGWRKPSLLVENDPPQHQHLRAMMNRVVSLQDLKGRRASWEEQANRLIADAAARRHIDAVPDIAQAYPMMIFPNLIGVASEGREMMLTYSAALFNSIAPDTELFRRSSAAAVTAIEWVANACRRENLSDGGWGLKVFEAADQGLCTEEEAEQLVRSFVSAGVDTTVNAIGSLILALARAPDQWQLLRANPSLAKRAVEESLRLDSAVQGFFRTTTREVEVSGTWLPEGAKVYLFLGVANRDPRRWDDPDKFEVMRNCSGHVAFGFGIHQCLGQMVARLEAAVILDALLRQVSEIRLTADPVPGLNNAVRGFHSLPVELVPA